MFDESSSSDSEPITSLRVNERFAEDFERRKRKQELAKAREAGLIDADGNIIQASDESSSESEDDDGALLSPETDLHIIKTLEAIRSKNPAIYKKDQAWFTEGDDSSDEAEGEANTAGKRQSRKKVTARDVIGQQVAEAAALGKSEVFDEEGEEEEDGGRGDEDDAPVNMYDEEQKRLREEFLKSVKKEAEDDSGSSDDEFLQVKPATREHLAATLPELLEDEKIAKALEPTEKESIQRFIKEPAQDEAEAFLKDYLLHRRWEAKDERFGGNSDDDMEDDDVVLEKQDEFEAAYNFRFEEEGGSQIVTHARNIEDSVRRKTEKRKKQRDLLKEKLRQEKEERERELRRLINLKREELRDQLKKVEEVAGSNIDYNKLDLDGDWDPDAFDKAMGNIFNDEYYEEEDEDLPVKPATEGEGSGSEDEGALEAFMTGEKRPAWAGAVDASDVPDTSAASEKAKKLKEMLTKKAEKEIADLHYEDVVGGMKTRFHYRNVPKADYGLDTSALLLLDDKDLNEYVSLKKLAPYREEEWYVPSKKRRKAVKALEERMEKALHKMPTEVMKLLEEEATLLAGGGKAKKKNIRREKKRILEAAAAALQAHKEKRAEEGKPSMKIMDYDEYVQSSSGKAKGAEGGEEEGQGKKRTRRSKKRKLTQAAAGEEEEEGEREGGEEEEGSAAAGATASTKEAGSGEEKAKQRKPKRTIDIGGVEISAGRLHSFAGPGLKKKVNESKSELLGKRKDKKKRDKKKKLKAKKKDSSKSKE